MQKSAELIQLEVCEQREALFTADLKKRCRYGVRGFEGEAETLRWFKFYVGSNLSYMTNYWFSYGNRAEIDLLVFTKETLFLLEVKNYDGSFRYKNGQCSINDITMEENIMNQFNEKFRKMRLIAKEFHDKIDVKAAMVFINEHCKVELDSEVDFDVVQRHELKQFIWTLTHENDIEVGERLLDNMLRVLLKYRTESPFKPHDFSEKLLDNMRKGVTCASCNSFETQGTLKNITCNKCTFVETKVEAVKRSARQLRWIYYYRPGMVTVNNLYFFMGGCVSKRTITRVLSLSYRKVGHTNKLYYLVDDFE